MLPALRWRRSRFRATGVINTTLGISRRLGLRRVLRCCRGLSSCTGLLLVVGIPGLALSVCQRSSQSIAAEPDRQITRRLVVESPSAPPAAAATAVPSPAETAQADIVPAGTVAIVSSQPDSASPEPAGLSPFSALAGQGPSNPISIRSDLQEADNDLGILTAVGHVQLDYPARGIKARADQVRYFTREQRIVFRGSVMISEDGGNAIEADRIVIDMNSGKLLADPSRGEQVRTTIQLGGGVSGGGQP